MSKYFTFVKRLALMLAVGSWSLGAFAGNNPGEEDTELTFSPTNTTGRVIIKAWNIEANAPATIKVLNRYGKAIYTNALESGTNHKKRYDFSQLEAGRYTLVLESSTKEISKPFVVGLNGAVREDKSEAYQYFRPMVIEKKAERTVHIAFSNVTNVPLKLTVSNSLGHVFYSEEVTKDFNKIIDLKKLLGKKCIVRVYNADYSYHAEVNK